VKRSNPSFGEKQQQCVRRICLALPGTTEELSHGEPTFFVGKKVFALFSNNHHNDGHIAVCIPAAIGIQAMLIEASPDKFYKPPCVGCTRMGRLELERVSEEELALHLHEAWRLIAPQKLRALQETQESITSGKDDGGMEYVISTPSKKTVSTKHSKGR